MFGLFICTCIYQSYLWRACIDRLLSVLPPGTLVLPMYICEGFLLTGPLSHGITLTSFLPNSIFSDHARAREMSANTRRGGGGEFSHPPGFRPRLSE